MTQFLYWTGAFVVWVATYLMMDLALRHMGLPEYWRGFITGASGGGLSFIAWHVALSHAPWRSKP